MLTAADATRVLEGMLRAWEKESGQELRPVANPTEYGPFWVQGYQSRAFVEDGDWSAALAGNGAVVVPKDGSEPFQLLSAYPAEEQLDRIIAEREQH